MYPELLVVPDAETLKAQAKEIWAWQVNRSSTETLRVLEREYRDFEIALPTASTIRTWVEREGWHEWFDRELERTYGQRARRLREGWFLLQELAQRRQFEALTGGSPLTKEESAQIIHIQKAFGAGTYGAQLGGEMVLQFAIAEDDDSQMSLEQRARRVRARMLEQNAAHGA